MRDKKTEEQVTEIKKILKKMDKLDSVKDFLHNGPLKIEILNFLKENFEEIVEDNIKSYALMFVHIPGFDETVPFLLDAFEKEKNNDLDYKWRIGNALCTIKPKKLEHVRKMIELCINKKHGRSREMMVLALGYSKNENVIPILIKLLDDKDVEGHALGALAKFKRKELLPHFEKFLKHKTTYIRNIAKRAVESIKKNST